MTKKIKVNENHYKALQWCLKNNIKVGVKPTKRGLKVEINDNNKVTLSPSYYPNIEAQNNQVLSIVDATSGKMAIAILMKSFMFKKALMQEHFNENYVESDKYPKATVKKGYARYDHSFRKIDLVFNSGSTIHFDVFDYGDTLLKLDKVIDKQKLTYDNWKGWADRFDNQKAKV